MHPKNGPKKGPMLFFNAIESPPWPLVHGVHAVHLGRQAVPAFNTGRSIGWKSALIVVVGKYPIQMVEIKQYLNQGY